jgi:hypothetical protein
VGAVIKIKVKADGRMHCFGLPLVNWSDFTAKFENVKELVCNHPDIWDWMLTNDTGGLPAGSHRLILDYTI